MSTVCTRAVFVASLALASLARAQGHFEGVVSYEDQSAQGHKSAFNYVAKGDKFRIEPQDSTSGERIAMIYNGATKQYITIMPSRKMYMSDSWDSEKMATRVDTMHRGWKFTKVGSETVVGISCDDYKATDGSGKDRGSACVAHGMGDWGLMNARNGPLARSLSGMSGWQSAMAGGFFPLKMVSINDDGKTNTLIATKVVRKSVDPSLFMAPAGYQKFEMPARAMPKRP